MSARKIRFHNVNAMNNINNARLALQDNDVEAATDILAEAFSDLINANMMVDQLPVGEVDHIDQIKQAIGGFRKPSAEIVQLHPRAS